MRSAHFFGRPAGISRIPLRFPALAAALGLLAVSACTPPAPPPPPPVSAVQPAPPPAPPAVLPFDQAVLKAANTVLSSAPAPSVPTTRQIVVIDPLVNGVTGEQSAATETIGTRIVNLAREKYPQFDFVPFTPQAVSESPYVMVGTFTPINADNQPAGDRTSFRFCLVMADLRTGKTVA